MSARLRDVVSEYAPVVYISNAARVACGNKINSLVLILITALPRQIIGKRLESPSAAGLDNHQPNPSLRMAETAALCCWSVSDIWGCERAQGLPSCADFEIWLKLFP